MRHARFSASAAALISAGVFVGSGSASAPASGSCIGQFFSSHAGSGAEGVTVGGFISPTASRLCSDARRTPAPRLLSRMRQVRRDPDVEPSDRSARYFIVERNQA